MRVTDRWICKHQKTLAINQIYFLDYSLNSGAVGLNLIVLQHITVEPWLNCVCCNETLPSSMQVVLQCDLTECVAGYGRSGDRRGLWFGQSHCGAAHQSGGQRCDPGPAQLRWTQGGRCSRRPMCICTYWCEWHLLLMTFWYCPLSLLALLDSSARFENMNYLFCFSEWVFVF